MHVITRTRRRDEGRGRLALGQGVTRALPVGDLSLVTSAATTASVDQEKGAVGEDDAGVAIGVAARFGLRFADGFVSSVPELPEEVQAIFPTDEHGAVRSRERNGSPRFGSKT